MRGTTGVILEHQRIQRLPRKMTLQHFKEISRKQLKRHFQCGADPRMIREWSEQHPSRKPSAATRLATEVTFRARHEHFLLKNTTFRAPAIIPNFTEYCACHEKWQFNITKYCACHPKWLSWLILEESILLRIYCHTNLLSYESIVKRIYSLTNLLSNESILKRIYSLTNLLSKESTLLRSSCQTNLLSYESIVKRIYSLTNLLSNESTLLRIYGHTNLLSYESVVKRIYSLTNLLSNESTLLRIYCQTNLFSYSSDLVRISEVSPSKLPLIRYVGHFHGIQCFRVHSAGAECALKKHGWQGEGKWWWNPTEFQQTPRTHPRQLTIYDRNPFRFGFDTRRVLRGSVEIRLYSIVL